MEMFLAALLHVIALEGGYNNVPQDPGGPTKYGVSLRFLKSIEYDINSDGEIDIEDIKALDIDNTKIIYKKHFWDPYSLADIDNIDVAVKLFSLVVNVGGKPAIKIFQRALKRTCKCIRVDGIIGKHTLRAANSSNPKQLIVYLKFEAWEYYERILRSNSRYSVFENGWKNRVFD